MRTLKLLGRLDVGAPKAFACFCGLGALTVAISNAPLLLCAPSLARVVSSDSDVQAWFAKIVWVLALHQQSRLTSINGMQLFVPLGKGHINVAANVAAFYVVAAPVVAAVALTDAVTTDVAAKMGACVGLSSIAQVCASSHDRSTARYAVSFARWAR